MLIIKRYIAKEFISFFLICFLSLLFIAIVFSTLAELPSLEKQNGAALFIREILSGIPLLIEVIVPISVLLATVLALISLSRRSEIIAMMAAGVSFFHLIFPVIVCGGVISGLLYLNQSYLAPAWGADQRASLVNANKNADIWRYHQDAIYFFASPNKLNRTVPTSRLFEFNDRHRITSAGFSFGMAQSEDSWLIQKQEHIRFHDQGIDRSLEKKRKVPNQDLPVVFTKELINPKYTSFLELIGEIRQKMKGAVNHQPDLFAFYQKVAGLLSIFVMIMLALPFSIYSGRSANVRTGIVISIVLGFVFWLVDQILLSFNATGMLPISISAFGANVLFFLLALILIRLKKA